MKIETVRYVDLRHLPQGNDLVDMDLKLTYHDGLSLYSIQEVANEAVRHNLVELMGALTQLEEGLLVNL